MRKRIINFGEDDRLIKFAPTDLRLRLTGIWNLYVLLHPSSWCYGVNVLVVSLRLLDHHKCHRFLKPTPQRRYIHMHVKSLLVKRSPIQTVIQLVGLTESVKNSEFTMFYWSNHAYRHYYYDHSCCLPKLWSWEAVSHRYHQWKRQSWMGGCAN